MAEGRTGSEFEPDKPGTVGRARAEALIEGVRQLGGVFVDAVRATSTAMAITDPRLSGSPIVFANAAFLTLSGYTLEEVLGQQVHFLNGLDTDPADAGRFEHALGSDRDDVVETIQYRKDGSAFVASVLISSFRDEGGRPIHHFASWTDISRRVEAESLLGSLRLAETRVRETLEQQAFLLQLGDTLRALDDPRAIQHAAMESLGRRLGVSRALYFQVDPNQEDMTLGPVYLDGVGPVPPVLRMSDFGPFTAEAYRRGEPVFIADVQEDTRFSPAEKDAFAAIQVRAGIGVPLLHGDRVVALVGVNQATAREWSPADLILLEEVAARTWGATELAASSAALRASEARFRALATVGSSSVYRMSPDWRDMHGLDGSAFLADTDQTSADWVDSYIPPDERPRVRAAIARAIAAKDVFELEHRVLRADGTVGWTASRAIPLFGEDGEISEWFGAARDITARVQADQSFARLFRASPAPFLVLKPDAPRFTIADVNDAYLAATMRTRDEVVGRGIFEAYPPNPSDRMADGASRLRASLERVLISRQPDTLPDLQYDVSRPDGTFEERWWSPVNSAVLDENGEVEALIHNAIDVTEERRTQKALRQSEEKYRTLFQSIDEGFAVIEFLPASKTQPPDFRFLEVNDAFENQTGNRDVPGKLGSEINPGADAIWIAALAEVARTGEATRFERYHQETRRWYDLFAARIGGPDSRQVCVVFADTTERKKREDRQAFLLQLSDALRAVTSPVEIMGVASEALGRHLGVGHCAYREADSIGEFFTVERDWRPEEEATVREVGERTWAAVERARVEDRLRDSEAQLVAAFESVPVGVAVLDLSGRATIANTEFRRFLKNGVIPSRDPERGHQWRAWDAEGQPLAPANFPGARAMRGESVLPGQEMLYTDDDGREIWTTVAALPILNADGEVTGQVSTISDIDALKRGVDALVESEGRFRQFSDESTNILWIRNAETMRMEFASPAYDTIYGLAGPERGGDQRLRAWAHLIEPEYRKTVLANFRRVRAGERIEVEFRVRRASDGALRWIHDTDFPLRDAAGKVRWVAGLGADITEAKKATERQKLLLAELQHRVRNILAMIRSIVRQSGDDGIDLEEFRAHLVGRLDALARTQVLLTRSAGARVDLDGLVRDELESQLADETRVTVKGPIVGLSPKAAEVLGLALHELATNSLKYGALSDPAGELSVTWGKAPLGDHDWLQLTWEESCKDVAPRPIKAGFGTELIEQRVPYELDGEAALHITGAGVRAEIAFPLTDGTSVLETGVVVRNAT